jgi:hypothetical protein
MAKLSKAISYMRGNARQWASPLIDLTTGQIRPGTTYENFTRALTSAFGDPDEVRTAERKLDSLRQTSSCSAYVAQFLSLASLLPGFETNKAAWILKFRKGLKPELKELLLSVLDEPEDFDEFTTLCVKLDNKLHAHTAEKRQNTGNSSSGPKKPNQNPSPSSSRPAPNTTKTSYGTAPGPMELDSTRRGPLTEKEKKYRRENNLCLYCGGEGHFAAACPTKKKKGNNKKQSAANAKVTGKAESAPAPKVEDVTPNVSAIYQVTGPKN